MISESKNNYVYIVRCSDDSLYTGWTTDIDKRMRTHNSGTGGSAAKYTRSRRPVELVYIETLPDRSSALRREAAIKKLSRAQKLRLIAESDNPSEHK